jgi:enamine deaminase RidA (YjgF/YER057c/UK114 family)
LQAIAHKIKQCVGEEAAEHLGLSHAVIVPANVRTIILSGQVGLLDGGIVPKALPEQVDLAFQHVEKALKAAGLGDDAWEHVYKV